MPDLTNNKKGGTLPNGNSSTSSSGVTGDGSSTVSSVAQKDGLYNCSVEVSCKILQIGPSKDQSSREEKADLDQGRFSSYHNDQFLTKLKSQTYHISTYCDRFWTILSAPQSHLLEGRTKAELHEDEPSLSNMS
jgi:hypothetical protein